ncbi:DEAD/DEAH box helicase, partial [Streptomyces sp. NPDC058613]|uniref:DEAD/DEAH box helicase n=1 Tax=Streptomyces sp. NPDC058613 TaxID=3346556 RepID=UPI00365131AA
MNRTIRTNDRSSRGRSGGSGSSGGSYGGSYGSGSPSGSGGSGRGSRFGSSAPSRSGSSGRSGGSGYGGGRRSSGPQGEFALPKTITPALPAAEAFADLDMPAELLAALGTQGVSVPFPIQAATLPNSLAGRDVLGRGRTGSGKTLAFGLALLARTAGQRAEPRQPLALILVPT